MGDTIARGGMAALGRTKSYQGTWSAAVPVPFPKNWAELSKAIGYSTGNYNTIGGLGRAYQLAPIGNLPVQPASGMNLRDWVFGWTGPPLTLLDSGQFYNYQDSNSLQTMLATLIHEPLHDSVYFHRGMRNIVPTETPPDAGPTTDAFSMFMAFLHNVRTASGMSLWQVIMQKVGPPPVRPAP